MESGLLAPPAVAVAGAGDGDGDKPDGRRGGWRAARFLIGNLADLSRAAYVVRRSVSKILLLGLIFGCCVCCSRRVPGARRVQRRAGQPGHVPGRSDGHVHGGRRRRRERVGRDRAGADARRRARRRLAARAVPGHLGRRRAPPAVQSLGTLTISSLTQATHPHPVSCHDATTACSSPPPPSPARLVFFNAALYLLALAQGFHNPCSLAFGADQFAPSDPSARASRSSYFNWYHFFNSCGYALSNTVLSYVEDSVSWTVGFAACLAMTAVYLPVFLLGTPAYRAEQPVDGGLLAQLADKYRAWTARVFPRKEAICTERLLAKEEVEVEDGNGFVVKLLPIWVTSIVFATVVSQQSTLFTKQGSTMDRRIGARGGGGFVVPPAALQLAVSVTMLTLLPIYDRALVPLARRFTGHPAGITTLQRVGAGMAVSCLAMVASALAEAKRLRAARDAGLLDRPDATVPMSLLWLVPQYVLVGLARAFGDIGLDEFFYDQVPGGLRSVGLAMSLSVRGVGSYASGVLVSGIDWATTRGGGESWFSDNLNRAHLDYFYGILAAVAALEVAVFLYVAKRYVYRYKGEP